MPPSHRKLSAWYHQLAQQLEAGLPFPVALRSSAGAGVSVARLEAMAQTIDAGGSIDDALRVGESWLPMGDLLALSAAADAGRMPRTLHHLSERHGRLGAAKLGVLLACLYPIGVLHLGLLLRPITAMIDWEKGFQWSTARYVRELVLTIGPLWAAIIVLAILARRGSPLLRWIASLFPGIGGYIRKQALADFSFALGNFLEAGVPIEQAWAVTGLITRSPKLKAAAEAMTAVIASGAAPAAKLAAWPCFPADFVALYRTGEQTGQLEANLQRLAGEYQDAANRSLTVVTIIYPMVVFLVIAAGVVSNTIGIYSGYLKMLMKIE